MWGSIQFAFLPPNSNPKILVLRSECFHIKTTFSNAVILSFICLDAVDLIRQIFWSRTRAPDLPFNVLRELSLFVAERKFSLKSAKQNEVYKVIYYHTALNYTQDKFTTLETIHVMLSLQLAVQAPTSIIEFHRVTNLYSNQKISPPVKLKGMILNMVRLEKK